MALFIGRIPKSMSTRELEGLFTKYGKINRLDIKSDFGFVEFEDKRDAEEAINELNGKDLVVEWAKNGGRRPNENECFNCGKEGHWAKDCQEKPRNNNNYNNRRGGGGPRRDFGGRGDRRGGRGDGRDYDRRDRRRDDRERSPRRDRGDRRDRGSDRGDRGERNYDRGERRSYRDDRERSPERH